ncbi:MAG: hypothetical protein RJA63_2440 [Pseudomonadota bacterium]|jgi:hypothetical protein
MSRLIAMLFCLTVLLLAGGWVTAGLVLLAVIAILLATFIGALAVSIVVKPVRRRPERPLRL